MSEFIRQVHIIQAAQPALDINAWTERLFLPNRPELMIMVTHDEEYPEGKRVEKTYLKMANTRPGYTVSLTEDEVKTLAGWSGKKPGDFSASHREANGIYMCGDMELEEKIAAGTPFTAVAATAIGGLNGQQAQTAGAYAAR